MVQEAEGRAPGDPHHYADCSAGAAGAVDAQGQVPELAGHVVAAAQHVAPIVVRERISPRRLAEMHVRPAVDHPAGIVRGLARVIHKPGQLHDQEGELLAPAITPGADHRGHDALAVQVNEIRHVA